MARAHISRSQRRAVETASGLPVMKNWRQCARCAGNRKVRYADATGRVHETRCPDCTGTGRSN